MVHLVCRNKRHIVMAVFANAARLDMRRTLSGSIYSVMAAGAIVDYASVIEVSGNPARGRMAVVAGVAANDVRWVLALRDRAIVAGVTGADDL